jgi:septum formation topological specificity factor MinE
MEASNKITEIIEQLKVANKNENEPKVSKISRLEIIFMEILQVLKTNIEDAKQRAKIERTFQEEKDYESELRHKEFLEVLKQFVSLKPEQLEDSSEKKDGGILDFFKNMIRGLVKTIKALFTGTLKLLGKLLKFTVFLSKRLFGILKNVYKFLKGIKWLSLLKNFKEIILHPRVKTFLTGLARGLAPAALLGLGIYAASEGLQKIVRQMPDYSKINYKEAENVLLNGGPRDIEHFATTLPEDYSFRPELEPGEPDISAKTKLQMYVRDAKMQRMSDLQRKFDREGTLSDAEQEELNQLEFEPLVPVVTETQLPKVPPRPPQSADGRAQRWDLKFGKTHNRDGTPKVKRSALSTDQFNVPPSTVGGGRGGDAQYVDYLARQIESKDSHFVPFPTRSLKRTPEINEPTIFEGDDPPPIGPNSFEELDSRQTPTATAIPTAIPTSTATATSTENNTAFKLPLPSQAVVMPPEKTKLDRNPYEKDLSDEGLRNFIRQNESSRLRNDLLRMAEEYEELGRILKGVSRQPMKPVDSSSPISKMFNDMNTENVNLQLQNIFATATDIKPVVNNNGRTEVIPDIPLSVEASQRDDTHTLSIVLNRYRKAYV